ncbi:MAG: RNA-processing protein [Candidatus Aenigmarchaeota archaeon]|nr:RNA-processing protein [Candidatus Aenigmarchaeota archaeon]
MIKSIKVPKARMPIVIGKNGSTKNEIEKVFGVKLECGEDVIAEGDAINVMDAENAIKAIGRGFPPEAAMKLRNEENVLFIIPLPKDKRTLHRLRSRIIGTGGKARRNMEHLTKTEICIYGKTVSIIGDYERADMARQAVEKLISGFSHRSVYAFLEKKLKKAALNINI